MRCGQVVTVSHGIKADFRIPLGPSFPVLGELFWK